MWSAQAPSPNTPLPFLNSLAGKQVCVKLKWGGEYQGLLKATDDYMNVQLVETVEIQHGKRAKLGEVFIRCNNVLYIRQITDAEEAASAAAAVAESKRSAAVDDAS